MNSGVRPSDAFMHPDPSVLALKEDGFRSGRKGDPVCSRHGWKIDTPARSSGCSRLGRTCKTRGPIFVTASNVWKSRPRFHGRSVDKEDGSENSIWEEDWLIDCRGGICSRIYQREFDKIRWTGVDKWRLSKLEKEYFEERG